MTEETKAPEVPTETSVDAQVIDKRSQIEDQIIKENTTFPDVAQEESTASTTEGEPSDAKTESVHTLDPIEKIKQATQKRIDKVVAQKKSAEEELVEAKAEIERLRNAKPEVKQDVESITKDGEPTIEQCEAYIIKMREEGNVKEEIAATRYLIKLEKAAAIKEVQESQTKAQKAESERLARTNAALSELAKDYVAYDSEGQPDMKSDMTLANQKGLLFTLAMDYYRDPSKKDRYGDPDQAQGFRRATADAYRDIAEHQITTPKKELVIPVRRQVLADPGSDSGEETTSQSSQVNHLSDADKVREEIKNRNKNRYLRKVSQ